MAKIQMGLPAAACLPVSFCNNSQVFLTRDKYGGNLLGKEGVVKEESKFIKTGLGICAEGFQEPSESKVIPFGRVLLAQCLALVVVGFSAISLAGINYESLMDPEPGRCRRTDGYKWRCRKDVLPNTKYCERHIHRGRSRKLVETSKITLQLNTPEITYSCSNTPITYSRKTSQKITSHNPDDTSAKHPTPVHENEQNKIPSLSESKGLTCTATAITTSANGKCKTHSVCVENDKSSRENSDDLISLVAGSNHIKDKSNKEGSNCGGSVTPEHRISAKSILYGDTKEPERCRRTDGRRWQCSNEAIPQKKYCESHMHRGSKRCRSSSEAETFTATPAAHSEPESDPTKILISPGKCPQPTIIDLDSSTSGSSSDSTTITDTDENISTSEILS